MVQSLEHHESALEVSICGGIEFFRTASSFFLVVMVVEMGFWKAHLREQS